MGDTLVYTSRGYKLIIKNQGKQETNKNFKIAKED